METVRSNGSAIPQRGLGSLAAMAEVVLEQHPDIKPEQLIKKLPKLNLTKKRASNALAYARKKMNASSKKRKTTKRKKTSKRGFHPDSAVGQIFSQGQLSIGEAKFIALISLIGVERAETLVTAERERIMAMVGA